MELINVVARSSLRLEKKGSDKVKRASLNRIVMVYLPVSLLPALFVQRLEETGTSVLGGDATDSDLGTQDPQLQGGKRCCRRRRNQNHCLIMDSEVTSVYRTRITVTGSPRTL
jgi:hypothetical protein